MFSEVTLRSWKIQNFMKYQLFTNASKNNRWLQTTFCNINDLFGIKLICLRSELNVASFWICMDAAFFGIWDVFNNFLLIDATDRSKIRIDQKRFFIAIIIYPLSFFSNTPFKQLYNGTTHKIFIGSIMWKIISYFKLEKCLILIMSILTLKECATLKSLLLRKHNWY